MNGKPRPFVLEYLGRPETLLKRLKDIGYKRKVKSYSHGGVFALLKVVKEIRLPDILKNILCKQKEVDFQLQIQFLLVQFTEPLSLEAKEDLSGGPGKQPFPSYTDLMLKRLKSIIS